MPTTSADRRPRRAPHASGLFLVPRGKDVTAAGRGRSRRKTAKSARWSTAELLLGALSVPVLWAAHLVLTRVFHV